MSATNNHFLDWAGLVLLAGGFAWAAFEAALQHKRQSDGEDDDARK